MPRFIKFFAFAFMLFTSAALAQERQWNLDVTNTEAFLIFGVPNTDDVGLSFWCLTDRRDVYLSLPLGRAKVRPGKRLVAELETTDQTAKLRGRASVDVATGRPTFEGKFKRQSSMWTSITSAESIKLKVLGHETILPLTDADFAGLNAACDGTAN